MIWKIHFLHGGGDDPIYKANVVSANGLNSFPQVQLLDQGRLLEFIRAMRAYEVVATVDPPQESFPPVTLEMPDSLDALNAFLLNPYIVTAKVSASEVEIKERLKTWRSGFRS